jgi:hypothetical protein
MFQQQSTSSKAVKKGHATTKDFNLHNESISLQCNLQAIEKTKAVFISQHCHCKKKMQQQAISPPST